MELKCQYFLHCISSKLLVGWSKCSAQCYIDKAQDKLVPELTDPSRRGRQAAGQARGRGSVRHAAGQGSVRVRSVCVCVWQ